MNIPLRRSLRDVFFSLALVSLAVSLGSWAGQRWQQSQIPPLVQDFDPASIDLPASYTPVLIANSTCHACTSARRWLLANGIPFSELTVDQSEHARVIADQLGVKVVPTVLVGSTRINGFDERALRTWLKSPLKRP